jgi:hypothetical protein
MRDRIEIGDGLDANHAAARVVLALSAGHDAAFAPENGEGFHQAARDFLNADETDGFSGARRGLIGQRAACHDLIGRERLRGRLGATLAKQHFALRRRGQFQP